MLSNVRSQMSADESGDSIGWELSIHTLMSLNSRLSLAKVLFSTEGLFFTLGKMIPPLRDTFFPPADTVCAEAEVVLVRFALLAVVLVLVLLVLVVEEDDVG